MNLLNNVILYLSLYYLRFINVCKVHIYESKTVKYVTTIGIARGGHGRAFALPYHHNLLSI